ncbi:signal peptidase I [Amycolatopsis lurida]|nr:signal peptidase I [Amycolatopsis lurida]SEC59937.1 signal peptidase I [Amycolatopsis lurida]
MDFPAPPPEKAGPKRRFPPLLWVMILVAVVGVGAGGYGFWSLSDYAMKTAASPAMSPTLEPGTIVTYRWSEVGDIPRGAVVLMDLSAYPDASPSEGLAIQRVIAVGDDQVVCCTKDGLITVNGKAVKETYVDYGGTSGRRFDVKVPPGTVFLAGDQRNNSRDSQLYAGKPGDGAVPLDKVHGVIVGIGRSINAEPFPQTTAFVDAGLPGEPVSDTGFLAARHFMLAGISLVAIGVIGAIVTVVRSAGKRRRAAAIPPAH